MLSAIACLVVIALAFAEADLERLRYARAGNTKKANLFAAAGGMLLAVMLLLVLAIIVLAGAQ